MSKKRDRKSFKHPVSGEHVVTGLPVEQNRLRGLGFVEQKPAPVETVAREPEQKAGKSGPKK